MMGKIGNKVRFKKLCIFKKWRGGGKICKKVRLRSDVKNSKTGPGVMKVR